LLTKKNASQETGGTEERKHNAGGQSREENYPAAVPVRKKLTTQRESTRKKRATKTSPVPAENRNRTTVLPTPKGRDSKYAKRIALHRKKKRSGKPAGGRVTGGNSDSSRMESTLENESEHRKETRKLNLSENRRIHYNRRPRGGGPPGPRFDKERKKGLNTEKR